MIYRPNSSAHHYQQLGLCHNVRVCTHMPDDNAIHTVPVFWLQTCDCHFGTKMKYTKWWPRRSWSTWGWYWFSAREECCSNNKLLPTVGGAPSALGWQEGRRTIGGEQKILTNSLQTLQEDLVPRYGMNQLMKKLHDQQLSLFKPCKNPAKKREKSLCN